MRRRSDCWAIRELVAALSGRGGLPGALEAAFKGTPLMAWGNLGNAGYLHPKVVGHRGDDVDLSHARSVSRDGRPAAADAVRRHLDADWRIAGDAVYRRASILARRVVNHSPGLLDVAHDPSFRLTGGFNAVASPTTYPALLALWQPSGIGEPDPRIEGWLAAGFGDAFHGDEHRVAANSYPASLRREVEYEMNVRAGIYGWEDDLVKALRVHRDAMLDLEVEGMTGVCGMDDPGPPLLAMQRALRLLVDAGCRGASVVGEFGMAQRVSRFYIPTLPDLRIEPEDDAALGAVVP